MVYISKEKFVVGDNHVCCCLGPMGSRDSVRDESPIFYSPYMGKYYKDARYWMADFSHHLLYNCWYALKYCTLDGGLRHPLCPSLSLSETLENGLCIQLAPTHSFTLNMLHNLGFIHKHPPSLAICFDLQL